MFCATCGVTPVPRLLATNARGRGPCLRQPSCGPPQERLQHRQRRLRLRRPGGVRQARIHHQTIAVFDQQVSGAA